jgi:hypothetical protein
VNDDRLVGNISRVTLDKRGVLVGESSGMSSVYVRNVQGEYETHVLENVGPAVMLPNLPLRSPTWHSLPAA